MQARLDAQPLHVASQRTDGREGSRQRIASDRWQSVDDQRLVGRKPQCETLDAPCVGAPHRIGPRRRQQCSLPCRRGGDLRRVAGAEPSPKRPERVHGHRRPHRPLPAGHEAERAGSAGLCAVGENDEGVGAQQSVRRHEAREETVDAEGVVPRPHEIGAHHGVRRRRRRILPPRRHRPGESRARRAPREGAGVQRIERDTHVVAGARAGQCHYATSLDAASATRGVQHAGHAKIPRRSLRMHAPRHAAAQLGRGCEAADGGQRERLKRRFGDDALADALISPAADDARPLRSLEMREVAAYTPPLALRAIHDGRTGERAAKRHPASERRQAKGSELDVEVAGANAPLDPEPAARQQVADAGVCIVEPHVRIHLQGARRTAEREVAVDHAAAWERERGKQLPQHRGGEAGDGEVGAAHQHRALPPRGRDADQRDVADDRGVAITHVGVGDRILRRVAVRAHGEPQTPTAFGRQLRVEPAQVREGHRRAAERQRETRPVEADSPVTAHLGPRQQHPSTVPPERVLRHVERSRERPYVDDGWTIRLADHRQRGDLHRRGTLSARNHDRG